MSFSTDYKKLKEAGVEFRDESFHSTFWGNRIIIRSRKDAIKAEKILVLMLHVISKNGNLNTTLKGNYHE